MKFDILYNRQTNWCERGDLNPHPLRDWILNPARLPIPPLSQVVTPQQVRLGRKAHLHSPILPDTHKALN